MDLCSSLSDQEWLLERLLSGLSCLLPDRARDIRVRRLVSLRRASDIGDLCFLSEPRLLKRLVALPPPVLCLTSPEHARLARERGASASLIETADPKGVWCAIVERLLGVEQTLEHHIHPSALIADGARLRPPLHIGAYSIIATGVEIGAGTSIGSHCVIEKDVKIGARCRVGSHTYIAHSIIADEVEVHEGCLIGGQDFGIIRSAEHVPRNFPQLGGVVIGTGSQIFMSTTIGRGALDDTIIGSHVRIGCKSIIGHGSTIGDYTIISSMGALAGSVRIGRYVTTGAAVGIGQNVTLEDHVGIGGKCGFWPNVTLGEGVLLMNGSVVKHDLHGAGKVFFGNPALPLREELHRRKIIDRLIEKPTNLDLKNPV